ncbi:MAG: GNAT family N-acetyltransferase [Bradymonadales bacterium]|jgi:ribosomal protein S18 acetylase RimI-like enzyme
MQKVKLETEIKTEEGTLEIRVIELEDLPKVFALGERLFTADRWPALYRTWDEYEVVTFFATDRDTCFVAYQDNELIGFVLGKIIEKRNSAWMYGYIVWLGVDPTKARRGVGTKLFKTLRETFIDLGARMLLADTDAHNELALRFFRKAGFDRENKHIYLSCNLSHHHLLQNYSKIRGQKS